MDAMVKAPIEPCVYILASKPNGTLYVGVTSQLFDRAMTHKNDLMEGFTKKYGVHMLVYYEMHNSMDAAIRREKQVKEWKRLWKIRLIEQMNPEWRDLCEPAEGIWQLAGVGKKNSVNADIECVEARLGSGLRRNDDRGE